MKASQIWEEHVAAWEAKLAGRSQDAEERFEAAKNLAGMKGFKYLPMPEVAKLPLDELASRVEAITPARTKSPDMLVAAAVLGGVPVPGITVSKALDIYWGLAKDKTLAKSTDQLRRWENPRKKAVKNFIEVVGDKDIAQITADDMLSFRDWWMERLGSSRSAVCCRSPLPPTTAIRRSGPTRRDSPAGRAVTMRCAPRSCGSLKITIGSMACARSSLWRDVEGKGA